MSEIKCKFCGNPEVELKPTGKYFCSYCNKQFSVAGVQKMCEEEFKRQFDEIKKEQTKKITSRGQEWVDYAQKYHIDDYEMWQMFLWKDGGVNISEDNLNRCQQLYDAEPDDPDNLLRLLMLKIFAEKDYKDLASKFLLMWKKRIIRLGFFIHSIYEGAFPEQEIIKFRNFLLWLMDVNPNQFKEEAKGEVFHCLNKVLGIAELSKIMNLKELLFDESSFDWDDDYLRYYALAKFYASEKNFLNAFCLFEKLRIYNMAYNVKNEELLELEIYLVFYSDILYALPTVEDIASSALECFNNINFLEENEKENIYNLIGRFYGEVFIAYSKIEDKDHELNSYLNIYTLLVSIFNEVLKENYEVAFDKWVEWDKSGIKLMGLDIWEMTQGLKDLKEGIGNKEETLKSILSNPFTEDFVTIFQIETKLREFVEENLKEFYKEEEEAWCKGVSREIRKKCSVRKEEASDPKLSKWAFFDLSDYSDIICERNNWNNIFKNYFIIEPKDANKSKDELTAPLRRVVEIRNTIFHFRRLLEEKERTEINTVSDLVNKVYEKWKPKRVQQI